MQSFIVGIIIKVLLDEKVQAKLKEILAAVIAEKVLPLLPLAVASAIKGVTDVLPHVSAPDIPDLVNTVRDDLNRVIPDIDIGIPLIDDVLDSWRPKA